MRQSDPSAARPRPRLAAVVVLVGLLASVATPGSGPAAAQSDRDAAGGPEARAILDDTLEQAPSSPASPDDGFEELRQREIERDEAAIARLDATTAAEQANVQAFNAALALQTAQGT